MYSQYSFYQNNPTVTQQQQPAATIATSTSGQVWNGQQWVATATNATQQPTTIAGAPPSYAGATSSAGSSSNNNNQIIKHGKTHSELVQHYTNYYHHWNTQASTSKVALTSLPPPHPNTPSNNAQREEMERREKWASYYASNSAALAHYHLALSKSGGGAEPYARPASPPVPPQTAGGGGGNGVVGAPLVAGGSLGAGSTTSVSMAINSSPAKTTQKKKSRWSTASAVGVGVQDNKNNGKSSAGFATVSSGTSVENKVSSNTGNDLYNKFVQEGQSNKNTFSETNTTAKSASFGGGGTKRKMMDRYDSNVSTGSDGYYGPSSSFGAGSTGLSRASSRDEDDFVPLALNKPLGSTPKKASKKEKKKQKQMEKQQKGVSSGSSGFDSNSAALSERAHRFKDNGELSNVKSSADNMDKYMGKTIIGGSMKQLDDHDYERMTVKGTCKTLEKEYLRLTSPPRTELVRPQPVMEKHLENLKRSYRNGNKVHNGRSRDYNWYCSQFKALRQDLTVQRITNAFAVDVYETHAKIALEEDDINEYNQSQTQLKELYDLIISGKDRRMKRENKGALRNQNEFIAYRIIYYVFLTGNRKYEGGSSDIFKIMLQLTPDQIKDECIHHALLVRAAVADNDYHKFFQLQDVAPNMGDYLMDKIVPSVRQSALQIMCRAYRPSVSAIFVLKELGFDTENAQEVEGGKTWLESCGCKFEGDVLVTKDTALRGSVIGVKNSLI